MENPDRQVVESRGRRTSFAPPSASREVGNPTASSVVESVWWTLRISFGLVPLLAGLDKFVNLLVYWPKYVAPAFASVIPASPQRFMYLVGLIEIVAGLGMLFTRWTKTFAYV